MKKNSLYLAWLVSLCAVGGSLFYSEVRDFTPCVLCWWQRVAMYPLVIILALSILYKEKYAHRTVLPLAILGFLIALYHTLLYYKVFPESAAPCINGVSCLTKYVTYFGFVSIPLLSLLSFLVIIILVVIYKKTYAHE